MWHIERDDLPRFAVAGLLGYTFYQTGFTVGIDHTSPFASSLMIAMMPLFALVIAAILGERYPIGAWLGVVIAATGVTIFLLDRQSGDSTLLGNALSAAAVALAGYWLFNRPLVRKYPPSTVSAYTTLIGTVPLLLARVPDARAQEWSALGSEHWLMPFYMAIFPMYLVYIANNWVISKRGVTATSASLVVPVVSGILSVIVFDEQFGPVKIGGGMIALLGLVLIERARMQSAERQKQAATLSATTGERSPHRQPNAHTESA